MLCPYCGYDLGEKRYLVCPQCHGDLIHYPKGRPWLAYIMMILGGLLIVGGLGTTFAKWHQFGFPLGILLIVLGGLMIFFGLKE